MSLLDELHQLADVAVQTLGGKRASNPREAEAGESVRGRELLFCVCFTGCVCEEGSDTGSAFEWEASDPVPVFSCVSSPANVHKQCQLQVFWTPC